MLQSNLQLDNEVKSDLFNDTAFLFYSFRRSSSVMAYAMPASPREKLLGTGHSARNSQLSIVNFLPVVL